MIYHIIRLALFLIGAYLLIYPESSLEMHIQPYDLTIEDTELAAKFYYRGLYDGLHAKFIAIVILGVAVFLPKCGNFKSNKAGSANPLPPTAPEDR